MKLQLLFTVLHLLHLSAGVPRLVCPETVEAVIGDNVTLRCQLDPEQNIERETIDCKIGDSNQLVYACRNGRELPDQLARFKRRTSLDFEDLKSGVLNLKINSVTPSDNATYKINIHKWKISSKVTLGVGVPPPSRVPPSSRVPPPSHVPPSSRVPPPDNVSAVAVAVGVVALIVVVVLVVVRFLVKRKVIQCRWCLHGDEDPHKAAETGQPAESRTMLEL